MPILPRVGALSVGTWLLAGAGCGGGTDPSDVPELRVVNAGNRVITLVNISPCENDQWGPNRVGTGIRPGRSRDFQLSSGCYDLRAGASVEGETRTTERRGLLVAGGVTFVWEVEI